MDEFPPQKTTICKATQLLRTDSAFAIVVVFRLGTTATGSPSSQRAPARRGAAWTRPTSTAGFFGIETVSSLEPAGATFGYLDHRMDLIDDVGVLHLQFLRFDDDSE